MGGAAWFLREVAQDLEKIVNELEGIFQSFFLFCNQLKIGKWKALLKLKMEKRKISICKKI